MSLGSVTPHVPSLAGWALRAHGTVLVALGTLALGSGFPSVPTALAEGGGSVV